WFLAALGAALVILDPNPDTFRPRDAADLLPERAGQPVKVWAHTSLADLLRLDGSSALQEQWTAQVRVAWAARRAGGDGGGAWLAGDAAEAIACGAAMAPIVTGDINAAALEDLVRLCIELGKLRCDSTDALADAKADADGDAAPGTPGPARAALEQAIIGKA